MSPYNPYCLQRVILVVHIFLAFFNAILWHSKHLPDLHDKTTLTRHWMSYFRSSRRHFPANFPGILCFDLRVTLCLPTDFFHSLTNFVLAICRERWSVYNLKYSHQTQWKSYGFKNTKLEHKARTLPWKQKIITNNSNLLVIQAKAHIFSFFF